MDMTEACKSKAATFREKAAEQFTGTSSQCPPLTSGVAHPLLAPTLAAMTLTGQTQPAPQPGAPTPLSTMLKHAGKPASLLLAQGLDMLMENQEGDQPPTGN